MPTYSIEHLDIGFVLGCAAVVFLMQAGFCLLESGLVRSKNSINVAVKNVLDCALAMLLFVCVGCSIVGVQAVIPLAHSVPYRRIAFRRL